MPKSNPKIVKAIAAAALKTKNSPTASTNKLTGNNKRITPISPGKKRKPTSAKPATTKPKAASPKATYNEAPSTKLSPPITHYPIFLLAHQLPSFNETINKAKKSPYLYSSEKQKTENILVSIFLHQYKNWYKSQFASIENPNPIPTPLKTRFTLIVKYQYSSNFDHDNIAFAKKYILDALQTANIIPNDNHSYISTGFDQTIFEKGNSSNFVTISLVPENEILSLLNKYL